MSCQIVKRPFAFFTVGGYSVQNVVHRHSSLSYSKLLPIIPYYAENYNPFRRIKSTKLGSAKIVDKPSAWNGLYAKTKAARRQHGNFIGRKTVLGIKIFCAASTAHLTRNRVGGIVKSLCHATGILRGHQVLHHVVDGGAHRKLVFGDGELVQLFTLRCPRPKLPLELFTMPPLSRGLRGIVIIS